MNAPDPRVIRRRAMAVVRAMEADIWRQQSDGILQHAGKLDETGHIHVTGTLDLARLALAVEAAMTREGFI